MKRKVNITLTPEQAVEIVKFGMKGIIHSISEINFPNGYILEIDEPDMGKDELQQQITRLQKWLGVVGNSMNDHEERLQEIQLRLDEMAESNRQRDSRMDEMKAHILELEKISNDNGYFHDKWSDDCREKQELERAREQFEKETGNPITYTDSENYKTPNWKYVEWLESRLAEADDKLRWRKVEEELPDDTTEVLVRWFNNTGIGFYAGKAGWWDQFGHNEIQVDHWLPIPPIRPLPQEEK